MNKGLNAKKRVVLIGASVGGAWRIGSLPQRIGSESYEFQYVHGGSQFDKSERVRQVLERQENRADVVILKECAAYFPGDLGLYRKLMEGWVEECRQAGVVPVPATVVPVTRLHAYKIFLGYPLLRGKNPFEYGWPFQQKRFRSLCAYNDWLRGFAAQEGLGLLDLEAALRISAKNRYLRPRSARLDGLHLKPAAYSVLDRIVIPALENIPE